MKNRIYVLWLLLFFITSCSKKEEGCMPVTPASEEGQIQTFAAANGITAVKHSSGIFYQVIDAGSGTTPTINSTVSVNYTGKLLNGQVFDQRTTTPISFRLSGVIEGWQIGIPLIKKGGKIKLIIPSSYAYACNSIPEAGIPANAILYFDISLLDVK